MNKNIIIISLFIMSMLTGCISQTNSQQQTIVEDVNSSDISNNNQNSDSSISSQIDSDIIKNICEAKFNELDGYKGGELYICQNYLKIIPPENLIDAPDIIYDYNGQLVTYCGGMPSPTKTEPAKECSIECGTINLCSEN